MTEKRELTTAQAFAMQFDSMSLLLRTTMPGRVVGVDLIKNTVDVQPVLMGKMDNEEQPFLLPIINDAPIQFYGSGNLWITFEPKPGSYCVLSISDRSMEAWKKAGGVLDPVLNRHHDMTDAIAYFGINPFNEALPAIEPDTMSIRTRDGLTAFRVHGSDIIMTVGGVDVCTMTASEVTFTVPIIAPEATIGGVVQTTHVHPQGNDSDGNTQVDTGVPQ